MPAAAPPLRLQPDECVAVPLASGAAAALQVTCDGASGAAFVVYRIKTTGIGRYVVAPPHGVLRSSAAASVSVSLNSRARAEIAGKAQRATAPSAGGTAEKLPVCSDKFLVEAAWADAKQAAAVDTALQAGDAARAAEAVGAVFKGADRASVAAAKLFGAWELPGTVATQARGPRSVAVEAERVKRQLKDLLESSPGAAPAGDDGKDVDMAAELERCRKKWTELSGVAIDLCAERDALQEALRKSAKKLERAEAKAKAAATDRVLADGDAGGLAGVRFTVAHVLVVAIVAAVLGWRAAGAVSGEEED